MKKILWLLIGIAAVLIVAGIIVLFVAMPSDTNVPDSGGIGFPNSGNTLPGSGVTGKIRLYGSGDTEFLVNDFINDGITVTDQVNPGNYILVGELGYCLADGSCPRATDRTTYAISYSQEDQMFTIVLLSEPLKDTRREAEDHLMNRLGITRDDMCGLNYYLGTPSWVSELYSNGDMGFSFCSGSTNLP